MQAAWREARYLYLPNNYVVYAVIADDDQRALHHGSFLFPGAQYPEISVSPTFLATLGIMANLDQDAYEKEIRTRSEQEYQYNNWTGYVTLGAFHRYEVTKVDKLEVRETVTGVMYLLTWGDLCTEHSHRGDYTVDWGKVKPQPEPVASTLEPLVYSNWGKLADLTVAHKRQWIAEFRQQLNDMRGDATTKSLIDDKLIDPLQFTMRNGDLLDFPGWARAVLDGAISIQWPDTLEAVFIKRFHLSLQGYLDAQPKETQA